MHTSADSYIPLSPFCRAITKNKWSEKITPLILNMKAHKSAQTSTPVRFSSLVCENKCCIFTVDML